MHGVREDRWDTDVECRDANFGRAADSSRSASTKPVTVVVTLLGPSSSVVTSLSNSPKGDGRHVAIPPRCYSAEGTLSEETHEGSKKRQRDAADDGGSARRQLLRLSKCSARCIMKNALATAAPVAAAAQGKSRRGKTVPGRPASTAGRWPVRGQHKPCPARCAPEGASCDGAGSLYR